MLCTCRHVQYVHLGQLAKAQEHVLSSPERPFKHVKSTVLRGTHEGAPAVISVFGSIIAIVIYLTASVAVVVSGTKSPVLA